MARNSLSYLGVVLAASQIGTRFTLVNSHLTASEVGFILDDCGATLVVTDDSSADVVDAGSSARQVVSLSPARRRSTARRHRRCAGRGDR